MINALKICENDIVVTEHRNNYHYARHRNKLNDQFPSVSFSQTVIYLAACATTTNINLYDVVTFDHSG